MEFENTPIKDVLLVKPKVFGDHRGYFYESYRKDAFEAYGLDLDFVQDNQSMSKKGILRGLHFQAPPFDQGKLVRVVKGAVVDVVVDIRKHSETYGQHFAATLTEENKQLLWVPAGFAHGFVTLEDDTIFSYKCTNYYSQEHEGAILWNSPSLNIDWQVESPVLSAKDEAAQDFASFITPFQ